MKWAVRSMYSAVASAPARPSPATWEVRVPELVDQPPVERATDDVVADHDVNPIGPSRLDAAHDGWGQARAACPA